MPSMKNKVPVYTVAVLLTGLCHAEVPLVGEAVKSLTKAWAKKVKVIVPDIESADPVARQSMALAPFAKQSPELQKAVKDAALDFTLESRLEVILKDVNDPEMRLRIKKRMEKCAVKGLSTELGEAVVAGYKAAVQTYRDGGTPDAIRIAAQTAAEQNAWNKLDETAGKFVKCSLTEPMLRATLPSRGETRSFVQRLYIE